MWENKSGRSIEIFHEIKLPVDNLLNLILPKDNSCKNPDFKYNGKKEKSLLFLCKQKLMFEQESPPA